MLSVEFQQQDKKPRIPVSTGCTMSLSRLCSTLTNSSELRFPSKFVSNKLKTISTTLSERDMPQTCKWNKQTMNLLSRPYDLNYKKWTKGNRKTVTWFCLNSTIHRKKCFITLIRLYSLKPFFSRTFLLMMNEVMLYE